MTTQSFRERLENVIYCKINRCLGKESMDEALSEILALVKECVPERKDCRYLPDALQIENDLKYARDLAFNDCRAQMLKNLGEE